MFTPAVVPCFIEFLETKSGLQKPTQAALKTGNKMKNKYRNIYACKY